MVRRSAAFFHEADTDALVERTEIGALDIRQWHEPMVRAPTVKLAVTYMRKLFEVYYMDDDPLPADLQERIGSVDERARLVCGQLKVVQDQRLDDRPLIGGGQVGPAARGLLLAQVAYAV